jgi:ABC-type multidrug transport system fused ATPase/permease subunit
LDTPEQNVMLVLGFMLVGFAIDTHLTKKFLLTMPTGNGFATMFRFKMMRHLSRLPYTYQSVADTSRCVSAPQPSHEGISQQPQPFTATAWEGSSLPVGPGRVQRTGSVVQTFVQLPAALLVHVQGRRIQICSLPNSLPVGPDGVESMRRRIITALQNDVSIISDTVGATVTLLRLLLIMNASFILLLLLNWKLALLCVVCFPLYFLSFRRNSINISRSAFLYRSMVRMIHFPHFISTARGTQRTVLITPQYPTHSG